MAKNSPVKTFVMQFLRAVISAVTVVLLSRWMGAAGRGSLSLMLFYVNVVMIANEYVGGSSLSNLIPKMGIPKLRATAFLWSLFVVLVAFFVFIFIGISLKLSILLTLFSFFLAQLTIHYNYYQGLGRVYQRNVLQLSLEAGRLVFVSATFMYIYFQPGEKLLLDLEWIIGIFLITTFLIWIVSSYLLRNDVKSASLNGRISFVPELFVTGFWSQNGQLIQFLNYRLALLLIEKFLGLESTGIYSNTLLIADTIWIFGNSFGTIAHMRMLRSVNKKFRADITLRYASVSIAGTIIACILIVLIPNAFFVWIFGQDFVQLKQTAVWFFPSILALGLSTVFSHYLHATDQFKTLLLANLTGLVIQVSTGFFLIPVYHLFGACIAANAGFISILIIVLVVFRKQNPGVALHGVFRFRSVYRILINMFR